MEAGGRAPYPCIVVGTDGSATATEAVRRTAALAQRLHCPLLVAVAFRRPSASELGPPSFQAQLPTDAALSPGYRGAAELAQDAAALATAAAPGVDVDTAAVEGEAAEALVDLAEARPGSLLAVGSQGMTGSRRFLLGAVPNKVSHHAPGDVLIVRTGSGHVDGVPSKVLVATDGSKTARRALDRALALAGALGVEVSVLTVSGDSSAGRRVLDDAVERAERLGVTATPLLHTGDPATEILAAARQQDLVVVGNRGMTGGARFLLGSVPHKVSHHVETDLLIVKTSGEASGRAHGHDLG